MRLELTILGTASQAPTRTRGQGGYVLRWADELILFDPGEGCQRQLLLAGVSAAKITRVCITHFHGDHCLGLPGFLQSRALTTSRRVALHYLAANEHFVDALLAGSDIDFDLRVDRQPLEPGASIGVPAFRLSCALLDHPTPAIGFRLESGPQRHLVADRLDACGLSGPETAELCRAGVVGHRGNVVHIDDVSEMRIGPTVAFIMDSALCPEAQRLAANADLLICESTYLSDHEATAAAHGHMTAAQAGGLAAASHAGLLVLSHFSSRYDAVEPFAAEARQLFTPVVAAQDLSCIRLTASSRPLVG